MASSVRNGCGRLLVVCCVRVSIGWGTSFGSDLWHALTLCLSCCYVTPRVTPFAQTHPESAHHMLRCPRRAGAGMDPGAIVAYRPPPPLPPSAEVLGAASTQPTT